jgi:hypothetical protein
MLHISNYHEGDILMAVKDIKLELLEQIEQWSKQIENLEDAIENAYHRIDSLGGVDDEFIETLSPDKS